jgi:hypothetical protein
VSVSSHPLTAARCNGTMPLWSAAITSAPSSSSRRTAAGCALSAAWSRDHPVGRGLHLREPRVNSGWMLRGGHAVDERGWMGVWASWVRASIASRADAFRVLWGRRARREFSTSASLTHSAPGGSGHG